MLNNQSQPSAIQSEEWRDPPPPEALRLIADGRITIRDHRVVSL